MNDNKKTKAQMLDELADLRRQVRKQEKLRKSLEKSEEKYRATVNSIEEGYYEVDLTGKYTFINPAAGKFHGHSPDELIGTSYSDYTTPETADRIFQIFNEIYRTGHPKKIFDYQLIHRDGKIRDLEISVSLVRDAEGNPIGFRGIGWDATERKIMEAEKERYRDFFENIEESCFEQDLAGNYTFINEAACRRFGYTREEILGMNFHDLTTPETAEKLVTVFNQVYQTGTPSELLDIEVFDKGKKPISIQTMASLIRDPGGNPIGFRGVARDITERKKMEKEQERYRDFIENMDDVCFELDLEGKVIFSNDALPRLSGYTPEEYRQLKPVERYASPEEAKRIFRIYTDMYREGKRGVKFYSNHRGKDEKIITLETSALLVRDAKGNPIGFRGISRDATELKKMEAEQERYRNFVENITDGVWENDLAGNMTFANEASCRIFGYTREELMGMNNRAYTTPETAKRTFQMFNEIYQTGIPAQIFDYEIIRKDGEIRWLEMSASLIRDRDGKPVGFRGVSRDVTERKKMEAEKERYRDFVENIEDGCYEQDLEGNYTFINEAACRRFGYTREEFVGLSHHEISSPETAKKMFKVFNEVYRTGLPSGLVEAENFRKDGQVLHIQTMASLIRDSKGNPIGFRGISRDVTERKKMEAEQERSRAFVENISDGCFEVDLAGNMTFVNDAACRMFGYPREEFLGMNNRDFTSPETAKRTFKMFNEIYRTGSPAEIFDYEVIHKDGGIGWLEMSASLIRDQAGKPVGFRGVSRDVTERKRMEAETVRLTEQLNQARKLEAIGTLAGGIAHEFNNMLMGIQGYASLMLLDIDTSHPFYENIKAIEAQVINAAGLTGQLLGYARGGRYEIKTTNLNELISKTASMFGRTKKGIIIHQTLDKALWTVDADQGQLEQVLLHLFMNAWQAMPAGGSLYLQTENAMLDESYVKSYETTPGPYVKISVTDTGMGMDVNTKERIFEPFFTTKEMGRGAGLGLASAYGIIRGHGGMINVYSEKGYGTTFNIYLPASKKEAIPEKLPAQEIINRKETILLVDDEKIITDVAGAMITRLGYQLQIVNNGEEAVEIYRANPDRIDLVIMDMIMPGIGGGKAFDLIQSINPQARIILSSGFSLNGEAKEIMNRGAKAFLQKPFLIDDLSRVIREVVEAS